MIREGYQWFSLGVNFVDVFNGFLAVSISTATLLNSHGFYIDTSK